MTIPFRAAPATKEIVFVRHAESQANRDAVWNGRHDGPLSTKGEETLAAVGERLSSWDFDVVISSSLQRARKTAESFASDIVTDDGFIELDLGRWEGKPYAEIQAEHGEELRRALTTRTLPMGETGETLEEAGIRVTNAVDALFEKLGEKQRAAVVTHGGALQAVLRRHLRGRGRRRVHDFTRNTGITRLVHQFGRTRLASFNDTTHLSPRPASVDVHLSDGNPVVALIRHGRTQANVELRWQGHGDWDLDALGHRQAKSLGGWYGTFGTVYSSPLKRAMSTAERVASNGVVGVDALKEVEMGNWEGMTTSEIMEAWPERMRQIYTQGVDLKRGETGESWGELTSRFGTAINSLDKSTDEPTVVVAHGGAIRSFISSLTETDDTYAESLYTPSNTSVTHVAFTDEGQIVLDYGVAPHLETLEYRPV